MWSALRRSLPRIGPLPRRLAAGACLLLACLTALTAHRPRAANVEPTRSVAVAVRSLAAGHVLTAHDLTLRRYPRQLAPPRAFATLHALAGRRVALPVSAGEPVLPNRLLGRDLTDGLGAGEVAAAVVLATPQAADVVRAGDRVNVLAGATDAAAPGRAPPPAVVMAETVRVLAVLPGRDGAGAEVVVATDPATSIRLAGANSSESFTVTLCSP